MTQIPNYPCVGCGCVCDDVTLTVEGRRVVEAANACELGRSMLTRRADESAVATTDGKEVSLDAAIDRAAELLAAAKLPLIGGLSQATVEAQREAVALADLTGACIDVGGAAERLFPDVGSVTCSLGEMMNRADFVVAWGARLSETYPRLQSRYAAGRTVVEVTAEQIGDEFAAVWAMRAAIRGRPVASPWTVLAERLKAAKCGVIVVTGSRRALEAMHALAADVNDFTRCYVVPLAGAGNPVGATQVSTWQTGYPAAVALARGYPRSFGREFSAERLVRRRETDLVVTIGLVVKVPTELPQVLIAPAPFGSPAAFIPCAAFPTHTSGTVFRTDGVVLPLPAAISSSLPTDFQVLVRIGQRLRTTRAGQ